MGFYLNTVVALFCNIVGGLIGFSIYERYLELPSPRDVSGPFLARYTRLWYFCAVYRGDFEKTNIALHRRFGKIVRIAPNMYSIDDPEAVRIIYAPRSMFPKAGWYYGFHNPTAPRETVFTTRDVEYHRNLRKKYALHYSMSTLVGYEGFVDSCGALLIKKLRDLSKPRRSIDLGEWLAYYAWDVIGSITYSKPYGFLERGEDVNGLIAAGDSRRPYNTLVGIFPKIHPYLFRLMSRIPGSGASSFLFLTSNAKEEVEKKKASLREGKVVEEGQLDQLSRMLKAQAEKPDVIGDGDILQAALNNIFAGADTTAISLTAIMHNLTRHPDSMTRLRDEIDKASAEGRISNPVTFKEAQDLPYLQAVIKEGMRVHPATGLPLLRTVPSGGVMIGDVWFAEGTTLGINTWVAHRNIDVFGHSADHFRPERWLSSDEEKVSAMEAYYFPFGLGSRNCLGRNISMLEMSKVLPELIRNFAFVVDHPKVELPSLNYWFVKQTDFTCEIVPRR